MGREQPGRSLEFPEFTEIAKVRWHGSHAGVAESALQTETPGAQEAAHAGGSDDRGPAGAGRGGAAGCCAFPAGAGCGTAGGCGLAGAGWGDHRPFERGDSVLSNREPAAAESGRAERHCLSRSGGCAGGGDWRVRVSVGDSGGAADRGRCGGGCAGSGGDG